MVKAARKFIDTLRLHVKGGTGGMGFPKFGGVGGNGGDIYIEAKKDITLKKTLLAQPEKRWKAGIGENSRKYKILGEPGKNITIPVPAGTIVKTSANHIIGDVNEVGDKVLVARGGSGGCPANQFNGQMGQAHNINLELKLIADVGLVGFPNAGKSTFLTAISRAKPKIASYPFTTLQPNIGIAEFPDHRKISIADLPGLIEGAWANTGMGHKFLRHVERTQILLFIIDINGFRLGPRYPHRTPLENIILLNKELEMYSEDLVSKPCLLVVNKMDCDVQENKFKKLLDEFTNIQELCTDFPEEIRPKKIVTFDDIIPCSAKMNMDSVEYAKCRIRDLLDLNDDINKGQLTKELTIHGQVKSKLREKSKRFI